MDQARDQSRVVRVFVCSTFRDFADERDLLMKRVFPELRRRARERFVEVIGVDLRWGITEEESQRGETLPICLREIERSRPYFIGLVGERYGWTPSADRYPERLLAQQPWLAQHAGGTSVTELEILHGVLNDPGSAARARFYFRDPGWAEGRGDDFRSENEDERRKLARLKERIRASGCPVTDYPDPAGAADRITEDLWRLIDAEYPAGEVPDELERERRKHAAYAAERRRIYVGQEDTVARLLARIEEASDAPGVDGSRSRITVVTGESGIGKSALIANAARAWRVSHPMDFVLEHYVGCSSDANDHLHLMRRVNAEVRRLTGAVGDPDADDDVLHVEFASMLSEASAWASARDRRAVVFLDAMDRMERGETMAWLPEVLPPCIRIVASTADGAPLNALRRRHAAVQEVRGISRDSARSLLTSILAERGRRLPEAEIARITAHTKSTLPIFLKTLIDELTVSGSFEGLSARIGECLAALGAEDLFEVILRRLDSEFGPRELQHLLEALWASEGGMSDDELLEFCRSSPLHLAQLKLSLGDTLYTSAGLNRLGHAHVGAAIKRRYVPTEQSARTLHARLGQWWRTQDHSARMAESMGEHLLRAGDAGQLLACLTDAETGLCIVRHLAPPRAYRLWRACCRGPDPESTAAAVQRHVEAAWPVWATRIGNGDASIGILADLSDFLEYFSCEGDVPLTAGLRRLEIARRLSDRQGTPEALSELSAGLENIGRIQRIRGNIDAAAESFRESLAIDRRVAEERGTRADLYDLSVGLDNLGRIELARGRFTAADDSFRESLSILRRLSGTHGSADILRALSTVLGNAGRVGEATGKLEVADERFRESLAINRRLAVELGIPESDCDLKTGLEDLGRVYEARGNFDAAASSFRESLDISRGLANALGTTDSLRGLRSSLDNVGRIELVRADLEAAAKHFGESLAIGRRLASMSMVERHDDLGSLSTSLANAGRLEEARGDLDAAIDHFRESLEICRSLADALGTPGSLRNLGASLDNVGRVELASADLDAALRSFSESLGIARRLTEWTGTPDSLRCVSVSLGNVARTNEAQGKLDAAAESFRECLAIDRRLADTLGTAGSLRDLGTSLTNVGRVQAECGDIDGAAASFRESLAIDRRLAEEVGTPGSLRDLGVSLAMVGRIEEQRGDLDAAADRYAESLAISRQLAMSVKTAGNLRDLAFALDNVGRIELARSNLDASADSFRESLEIHRQLVADSETERSRANLVRASVRIAHVEVLRGAAHSAIILLEGVFDVAEALDPGAHPQQAALSLRYWMTRTEVLEALGWKSEASASRRRAVAIQARIDSSSPR